jgi:hypothetical protein
MAAGMKSLLAFWLGGARSPKPWVRPTGPLTAVLTRTNPSAVLTRTNPSAVLTRTGAHSGEVTRV